MTRLDMTTNVDSVDSLIPGHSRTPAYHQGHTVFTFSYSYLGLTFVNARRSTVQLVHTAVPYPRRRVRDPGIPQDRPSPPPSDTYTFGPHQWAISQIVCIARRMLRRRKGDAAASRSLLATGAIQPRH